MLKVEPLRIYQNATAFTKSFRPGRKAESCGLARGRTAEGALPVRALLREDPGLAEAPDAQARRLARHQPGERHRWLLDQRALLALGGSGAQEVPAGTEVTGDLSASLSTLRSEERRVGKE